MRAWALAIALATGCATGGSAATRPARGSARLVVTCPVDEAAVYVDEKLAGHARALRGQAIIVPAGTRRVEVRAEGYFSAYREVELPEAGSGRVEVALRHVPPGESGGW